MTGDELECERARCRKLFNKKRSDGFNNNIDNFVSWWIETYKSQKGCCYYCETSIVEIRKLISNELLNKRKTGYGWRGPNLEIDCKDSNQGYRPENCVLACYYCNNDKSYIYKADDYKKYFGTNRKRHFEDLAKFIS